MSISQILIATKGRPQSKTVHNLVEEGFTPILFLEKEDGPSYQEKFGGKVHYEFLPESNQGIAYVRQKILNYARDKGFDYYWTLDDDISNMYSIVEGKSLKTKYIHCLEQAELLLRKIRNLAVGGLEYNQFAWAQKQQFKFNGYAEVATFVNVNNTRNVNYRKVALKEDRDFVLQSLALGYVSARTSWFAFACPKNGTNKGGLHEVYSSGIEASEVQKLCRLWPGVCEPITKRDGRPDAKIRWDSFKTLPVFEN